MSSLPSNIWNNKQNSTIVVRLQFGWFTYHSLITLIFYSDREIKAKPVVPTVNAHQEPVSNESDCYCHGILSVQMWSFENTLRYVDLAIENSLRSVVKQCCERRIWVSSRMCWFWCCWTFDGMTWLLFFIWTIAWASCKSRWVCKQQRQMPVPFILK